MASTASAVGAGVTGGSVGSGVAGSGVAVGGVASRVASGAGVGVASGAARRGGRCVAGAGLGRGGSDGFRRSRGHRRRGSVGRRSDRRSRHRRRLGRLGCWDRRRVGGGRCDGLVEADGHRVDRVVADDDGRVAVAGQQQRRGLHVQRRHRLGAAVERAARGRVGALADLVDLRAGDDVAAVVRPLYPGDGLGVDGDRRRCRQEAGVRRQRCRRGAGEEPEGQDEDGHERRDRDAGDGPARPRRAPRALPTNGAARLRSRPTTATQRAAHLVVEGQGDARPEVAGDRRRGAAQLAEEGGVRGEPLDRRGTRPAGGEVVLEPGGVEVAERIDEGV